MNEYFIRENPIYSILLVGFFVTLMLLFAYIYHLTKGSVEKFPNRPLYKKENGDDHIYFLDLPLGWRIGPKSSFKGSSPTGNFWYKKSHAMIVYM